MEAAVREVRVHVDAGLQEGAEVALSATAARHLSGVLRLRKGAPVVLFDGSGDEFDACLSRIDRAGVSAVVRARRSGLQDRESAFALTLVQGVSRGERMDFAIQKSVELGVAAIVPLLCERSVVRLDAERAERRAAHWRAVAIGACEQCGRRRLPQVHLPISFEAWLRQAPASGLRLTLSPQAASGVGALPAVATSATLVIGPEGGLAPGEQEALSSAGFTGLRLGPRVLRTETAALAAVAALQLRFGDLGE